VANNNLRSDGATLKSARFAGRAIAGTNSLSSGSCGSTSTPSDRPRCARPCESEL
jgi:hypothetical protein